MTEYSEKNNIGWNMDNSYARLPEIFYSKVRPTPVRLPELVIFNDPVAEFLGLNPQAMKCEDGEAIFAGNQVPEGSLPLAQAYAGHQFGYFTMLGDGRAVLLGEQINPEGERVDIQLKGSGRTPYSRRGDGRATLGPMLREYIISEAMHALGIPTTRSLAVVKTGETVVRDTALPGAVLTRVASSHIRVGTFEYISQWGTIEDLHALADYTLKRHFRGMDTSDTPALTLLREVVHLQAKLIAKWQLVGFIHGVMNTDNMVLSGETIDYGPCAFMDTYDPKTVFSSIDTQGRYAYGNQPSIAIWNLARFAECLLPLIHDVKDRAVELAQESVQKFNSLFKHYWLAGMRAKLGIFNEEQGDEALIEDLLKLMHEHTADYTNTFIALTFDETGSFTLFEREDFMKWRNRWKSRLSRQQEPHDIVKERMHNSNPAVIPRNHRVEAALNAAVQHGDYKVMEKLLHVLSNPYAYSPEQADYATPPEPTCRPYQTFCGT